MRIKSLATRHFKNLKNDSPILFNTQGLTVITGPNEAGKTSLLEALAEGLLCRSSKAREPVFQCWSAQEKPVIELVLETEGREVAIERNYQEGKSFLRSQGLLLKNEETIKDRIHDLTGFTSAETFRSLLVVGRHEMTALDGTSIQMEIDTLLAGGGESGMTVFAILSLLDEKMAQGRDRLDGDDGRLFKETIEYELFRLTTEHSEQAKKIENSCTLMKRFEQVKKESAALLALIGDKEAVKSWLQAFIPYRDAAYRADKLKDLSARLDILHLDTEREEKDLLHKDEQLKAYRTLAMKGKDLEALERDLKEIDEKLGKIAEIEELALQLAPEPGDLPVPTARQLDSFKKVVLQAANLDSTLKTQIILVDIETGREITIEDSRGRQTIEPGGKYHAEITGNQNTFTLSGETTLTITNQGLSSAEKAFDLCRKKVRQLYERFRTPTVEALEERVVKDLKRKQLVLDLDALLGKESQEEVRQKRTQLQLEKNGLVQDMEVLRKQVEGAKALEVEEALHEEARKRVQRLKEELSEIKARRVSVLGDYQEEELASLLTRYSLELAKTDIPATARESFLGSSLMELNKSLQETEGDRGGLQAGLAALQKEEAGLRTQLQSMPVYEDLAQLEERIAVLAQKKKRANVYLRSLIAARDGLAEASQKTREILGKRIDELCSKYFKVLTLGKYDGVALRLANPPQVSVRQSREKAFRPLTGGKRILSTGAMHQLYFAVRLALVEILTQGRGLPLILDDPFVDFDPWRHREALEVLKTLSGSGCQCILLTCKEEAAQYLEQCATVVRI